MGELFIISVYYNIYLLRRGKYDYNFDRNWIANGDLHISRFVPSFHFFKNEQQQMTKLLKINSGWIVWEVCVNKFQ